jgi:hypothetical protein
MKIKKIKYKYIKKDKKLIFNWEKNEKIRLLIEQDESIDFNNLYDFIIENVNDIEFIDETSKNDKEDKNTASYKALQAIISAIKKEHQKIKKEYKRINLF